MSTLTTRRRHVETHRDAHRTEPHRPATRAGFLLYVGVPDAADQAARSDLVDLAETLRDLAREQLPTAETYTSLALAEPPAGSPGSVESIDAFRDRLSRLAPVPRVEIDAATRVAHVDGSARTLTSRELHLLRHLLHNAERVVTRAELLATVWADEALGAGTRTIDVHVRRLREKLGVAAIRTVRGVGYGLDPHTDIVLRGATA